MTNQIDTMGYMGDWMDRLFEMELEVMFEEDPKGEDKNEEME